MNCVTGAVASAGHSQLERSRSKGCSEDCSTDHKHYVITGISDLGNGLKTDANGMYPALREPLSKI